jgi:hypothetical protein
LFNGACKGTQKINNNNKKELDWVDETRSVPEVEDEQQTNRKACSRRAEDKFF